MSTGLALLGIVTALASVAAFVWAVRGRRLARRARRLAVLASVAERVDRAVASLGDAPASSRRDPAAPPGQRPETPPLVADALPGRAGLVDALHAAVQQARADGSRLTAGLVESEREIDGVLAHELRATAGSPVYLVGPRTAAVVLPGFGRAAALGVLARVQAAHGMRGRVVELEPGESAVELAARLLASVPGGN